MDDTNMIPADKSPLTVTTEMLTNDSSRRAFLTTLMGGAAAATALAATSGSVFAATGKLKYAGASVPSSDAAILNYALTLEHLEAAFYVEASNKYPNGNYVHRLINVLRNDEISHVNALTAAIKSFGYKPVGAASHYMFPNYFRNRKKFLSFANVLENTGVHAYLGQAPHIKTPAILLTAASIVTVEARHAGALAAVQSRNPTQGPFDTGYTMSQVLKIAGPLIGK